MGRKHGQASRRFGFDVIAHPHGQLPEGREHAVAELQLRSFHGTVEEIIPLCLEPQAVVVPADPAAHVPAICVRTPLRQAEFRLLRLDVGKDPIGMGRRIRLGCR